MSKSTKRPVRKKRKLPTRAAKPDQTFAAQSRIAAALQFQKAGDIDQAKTLYLEVLKSDPENPDAWHLLGMALHSIDQHDDAVDCLQNAVSLVPGHPEVLASLGLVYRGAGKLVEARSALEQSIRIQPDSSNARNNLGTILLEMGELQLAEVQFEHALALNPNFDNATMNLANVWQKQGRSRDAEMNYRQLLERNPENATLLNNLGESLRNQGKWEDAADAFTRAATHAVGFAEAQINLGRILTMLRQPVAAQRCFVKLIECNPELARPYHYLGELQQSQGDTTSGLANIAKSVQLDPTNMYARSAMGCALLETGQTEEAEACFRKIIHIDPTMSEAHGLLLFILSGNPSVDQDKLFAEHVRWGEQHGNVAPLGPHKNDRQKDRRLRIGYVSPDMRTHAVAAFFRPVLASHDADLVETYCYAELSDVDETTKELQQLADHWRFTKGLSTRQVAEQIKADQIDILIDLAGHTAGNRLISFAHRPAPVQITWLGYPNTTGIKAIDYRLTCETQNPSGETDYHTEELVRLKHGSFCFTPPKNPPPVNTLPAATNEFITFGSLHRPFKISETARDFWADVLLSCPTSRMVIFNTRFTKETTEELYESLSGRGIDRSRIDIRNEVIGESYLETYHEVDIGLDVTPWAGGTTTMEALWMGVPVVAFHGDRRSSRSTSAIMRAVGHEELVAHSREHYHQLATELASDIKRLSRLRKQLRSKTQDTIAHAKKFTRELESTYRALWTRWCKTSSPQASADSDSLN